MFNLPPPTEIPRLALGPNLETVCYRGLGIPTMKLARSYPARSCLGSLTHSAQPLAYQPYVHGVVNVVGLVAHIDARFPKPLILDWKALISGWITI